MIDKTFVAIDEKLRKENNLVGFLIARVTRQAINGFRYTVSYKKANITSTYAVIVDTNGKISLDNATPSDLSSLLSLSSSRSTVN